MAVILAIGLSAVVILILVATLVQILHNSLVPEIQLSENATTILTGALGALTGLLGGYMGSRGKGPPN